MSLEGIKEQNQLISKSLDYLFWFSLINLILFFNVVFLLKFSAWYLLLMVFLDLVFYTFLVGLVPIIDLKKKKLEVKDLYPK